MVAGPGVATDAVLAIYRHRHEDRVGVVRGGVARLGLGVRTKFSSEYGQTITRLVLDFSHDALKWGICLLFQRLGEDEPSARGLSAYWPGPHR